MINGPLKIAVLLSGSGSTLLNLVNQIDAGKLDCTIELVIGSRAGLKGIERATDAKLPVEIIDPRPLSNVSAFSNTIFDAIDSAQVDLVCLAGWLCLLEIPQRYEGRILNIHPSLLPSFGGKGMYGEKVHQAVLDRGCTISGCTVHYVDNQYDNGPILLQRPCPVLPNDTAHTLAARVFEQEKIAYPDAIRLYQVRLRGTDENSTIPLHPGDMRKDYQLGEMTESDAAADPIEQFSRWFGDAQQAGIPELNAMTLATADAEGKPSARIVLLKEFDAAGFVFYTNQNSQKGRELEQNPQATLVFFWEGLERQVRVNGSVERVSIEQSEKYFQSRPVNSQIGAWVSDQSNVIASREDLEKLNSELHAEYFGRQVPMPPHWGGYRVIPSDIEFWQGRRSRLHDRLRYRRDESNWKLERLAP